MLYATNASALQPMFCSTGVAGLGEFCREGEGDLTPRRSTPEPATHVPHTCALCGGRCIAAASRHASRGWCCGASQHPHPNN
jgi:hypothetical protein